VSIPFRPPSRAAFDGENGMRNQPMRKRSNWASTVSPLRGLSLHLDSCRAPGQVFWGCEGRRGPVPANELYLRRERGACTSRVYLQA
jgi:hypothetical protein